MTPIFTLGPDGTVFIDGFRLDPRKWRADTTVSQAPGQKIGARAAMGALLRTGPMTHLVVGVIGPRDATAEQISTAESIGKALAGLGVTTICGGRSGVMEAVCKGVSAAGGLAIGILPGATPDEANAFVGIPLPTGLGEARNMIIAKSARVLIAIGGSYGTLSEGAYGLHFGKAVIGLNGAPDVEGVRHADSVDGAIDMMLNALARAALTTERRTSFG